MLSRVELENYRCFERHAIPLRPVTVIVGANNAGKSTLAEAFRLLSIVVNRCKSLNYYPPPAWAGLPLRQTGVKPSVSRMGFDFTSVFHRYGNPPAHIRALFDSGHTVTVHIGPDEELHGVVADPSGREIADRAQARREDLPLVSILPQIGPVAREEAMLRADYVQRYVSSALAPLHFRNQLFHNRNLFPQFKQLAERSWPGLEITAPELEFAGRGREQMLSLLVRDGDFVAEVAGMGHGLQMWLQVLWFLTRCAGHETIILDEPDVYMHADLQLRLMGLLRGRHRQVVVATHSVEIMSQVDPDEVVVLDRRQECSPFAASLPGLQRAIDDIGSIHNLQLARLWSSRRLLVLEGGDLHLLKHIHATLHPESDQPIHAIPHMRVGGWGGWQYAVGSRLLLSNAAGESIRIYCILDRDYHSGDEVAERLADAASRGVELHVWRRKEIENYLLVPAAIARVIAESMRPDTNTPTAEEVSSEISTTADFLRQTIEDGIATEHLARHKRDGLQSANRAARQRVEKVWESFEGRLAVVPGSTMLAKLSEWSQERFGVSLSATRIARNLEREEIAPEVVAVLDAIEHGHPFERGAPVHDEADP